MQRCRRQWLGVAMNVYAKLRHNNTAATATTTAQPYSSSTATTTTATTTATSTATSTAATGYSSAGRASSLSCNRLLPAPARLPPCSSVLHVSVLSSKRRVSRLAPLRNRARRRVTAAVMSVLSAGARGGLDVWVDTNLASGLVSAHSLRAEADEAMRAVGALQPHRASEKSSVSFSQSTMWRQRLVAAAASRERLGGLPATSSPLSARPASTLLPVSMQLAIALYSHSSPSLPGGALLSRLSHLCSVILQPPVSALSRHSGPFSLLQPYTSRRHKHSQRRQLRQCIAASTEPVADSSRTQSPQDAALLGVRVVEECVRWLSEREGEGRQEVAAVLCEARVWLSFIVHSDGNNATSAVINH